MTRRRRKPCRCVLCSMYDTTPRDKHESVDRAYDKTDLIFRGTQNDEAAGSVAELVSEVPA